MALSQPRNLELLKISSRSFGEREIAIYGELSLDHNPIHSDKDFAAKTPFGHPIVYGFLLVMPIWEAIGRAFGNEVFSSSKATIRFLRPLLVGQTAHYRFRTEETADGLLTVVTITDEGGETIAVVQTLVPASAPARDIQ